MDKAQPDDLVKMERRIDHSNSLQMITAEIVRLNKQGKPKLIGIRGQARSGKTTLAKVLSENGVNVEIIDVAALKKAAPFRELDISTLLNDPAATYIVDEASFLQQELLSKKISRHSKSGGCAVIMVQDKRHLKVKADISWFSLSHQGLVAD